MNQFPFTEADLQAAAIAVSDSMLNSLPEPDGIEHEFSEGFLAKMDALLLKDRRRRRVRSIARRAAMIALAVVLSIGVWLSVDAEARAALVNWARELSGNGFAYRFFVTGTGKELPGYSVFRDTRCVIGWLPEGYDDQQHDYYDYGEIHYFVKKGQEGIFFSWAFCNEDDPPPFYYGVRENGDRQRVKIRGNVGEYIPDSDGAGGALHWVDEKSGIQMELHSALDRKTMLRIAKSVTVEETPDLPEYAPAWIPAGFVAKDITQGRNYCARPYWNAATRSRVQLTYSFMRASQEYGYLVDRSRDSVETVTIWGHAADFYPSDAENLLIWAEEDLGIFFRLEGGLSKEELVRMAESVALLETPD